MYKLDNQIRHNINYIILLPVLLVLSISLSFLLISGQYNIFVVAIFSFIIIALLLAKSQYLLYYYLLFGALTFPTYGERIGGLVGLNWLRTTVLALIYVFYCLILLKNFNQVLENREGKLFLIAIFPWVFFVGLSITWAISPTDSMRYYPKYIMSSFLALALLLNDRISSEKALRFLLIGGIIFLSITALLIPVMGSYKDYGFVFQGISGRYQAKYYLGFLSVFSLSMFIAHKGYKRYSFLSLLWSLVFLVLTLQRSAILAVIISFLAVYIFSVRRISWRIITRGIATLSLVILGIYLLFYTPRFQSYMFYSSSGAGQFTRYMKEGDVIFAIDQIDFKGRREMWEYVLETNPRSLIGIGFASTGIHMRSFLGFYNELHGDWLQYLIETGYFGFSLYILMWLLLLRLAWKHRKSDDAILRTIALSLGGHTIAIITYSLVDHVMDYTDVTGAYLFMLAALLVKKNQELEREEHAISE